MSSIVTRWRHRKAIRRGRLRLLVGFRSVGLGACREDYLAERRAWIRENIWDYRHAYTYRR